MAIEIVQVRTCDVCAGRRTEVKEAKTFGPISLNGGQPRWIELCEEHELRYLIEFARVLEDLGRPFDTSPPKPARPFVARQASEGERVEFCLLCSYTAVTRNAIRQHYASNHGSGAIMTALGKVCPICTEVTSSASKIIAHVQEEHDQPTLSAAFHKVQREGDPRGAVKAALERFQEAVAA